MGTTTHSPADPARFRSFGKYFKAYMAVATGLAAIPFFVAFAQGFPMYDSMRATLAAITPIFSFLLLGICFFYRHAIARALLPLKTQEFRIVRPEKVGAVLYALPFILAILAAASAVGYYITLDRSLHVARSDQYVSALAFEVGADTAPGVPRALADSLAARLVARRELMRGYKSLDLAILAKAPGSEVVGRYTLMLLYLGLFLFAESAFVVMALREYLQDVMGYSDAELINRPDNIISAG